MFLRLSLAFNLSHAHVLPGILVKAMSFSTREHVYNELPGELCSADSKPFSSFLLQKMIALIINMNINSSKALLKYNVFAVFVTKEC